jgi:hypothetical protein
MTSLIRPQVASNLLVKSAGYNARKYLPLPWRQGRNLRLDRRQLYPRLARLGVVLLSTRERI